ncbi:hypothetical protein ILUMI_04408 [Ignelater luminosus]|uniref:Cytochrome P450 n=1 Tax=Ignelater luminosus TaxID=2038154 RepID=A0A8K0D9R6_IGNLU|nr:hypothetical protein ILUMI_04408 [Ignelater luminosus]
MDDLYTSYKDYAYVGFYNFLSPAVLVRDVELIKDVLIKQFNNFHDNWIRADDTVDPIMAKNLFVMRGDEWKIVRTQLTAQYTGAKVKQMIPMMQEVSKRLIEYINKQIEVTKSNCFEAKNLATRFTGENVLTCAYGLEGKSFVDDVPVAFEIGEQIASPHLSVQIKQAISLFFPLVGRLLNTTFIGSPIPKVFWDMILNTMKYREENGIVRKDYLDFLRELRKSKNSPYEVNDTYTVAHAFTFFLDAFETSAGLLTYTLCELALHPEIQTKTRTEIETVLEKYKGELSYEALAECEYLENVVFESLRRNPILPFLSRVCTEEYRFPPPRGPGTGKEVIIEKGTQMFIPVYGIHRDPQYYPDPDRFNPDRFTEEGKATRPKSVFLGFGDGPRICLGRNYGVAQIKVVLVAILNEFELRMSNKTKIPHDRDLIQIINVPKDGMYLELHKRF